MQHVHLQSCAPLTDVCIHNVLLLSCLHQYPTPAEEWIVCEGEYMALEHTDTYTSDAHTHLK